MKFSSNSTLTFRSRNFCLSLRSIFCVIRDKRLRLQVHAIYFTTTVGCLADLYCFLHQTQQSYKANQFTEAKIINLKFAKFLNPLQEILLQIHLVSRLRQLHSYIRNRLSFQHIEKGRTQGLRWREHDHLFQKPGILVLIYLQ